MSAIDDNFYALMDSIDWYLKGINDLYDVEGIADDLIAHDPTARTVNDFDRATLNTTIAAHERT